MLSSIPVRQKILDLAFWAFNQRGYKGVSMDLVARELGISKKTIYKHFSGKEEILEVGLEQLFERTALQLNQGLAAERDKSGFWVFFVVSKQFRQGLSPVLRAEIQTDMPYLEERILTFEKQTLQRKFSKFVKELRTAEVIDYPSPTREFTPCFFDLLYGLQHTPEDKARLLVNAVVRGMSVRKKKKK